MSEPKAEIGNSRACSSGNDQVRDGRHLMQNDERRAYDAMALYQFYRQAFGPWPRPNATLGYTREPLGMTTRPLGMRR